MTKTITPEMIAAQSASLDRSMAQLAATALRIKAERDELLAVLEEFEIQTCNRCDGNGKEEGTDEHNACHYCGGAGEVVRGGWPAHLREAIAKAKQS